MNQIYLTTDQLAERIHYDARTIRNCLKDAVLLEGIHYIRPFGGRKLLFIWDVIQRDIGKASSKQAPVMRSTLVAASSDSLSVIPMANGRVANG